MPATIIVVIETETDKITNAQCETVRQRAAERGHRPRLVRAAADEFFLWPDALEAKYMSKQQRDAGYFCSVDDLEAYTVKHVASFGGRIVALVMPQRVWDDLILDNRDLGLVGVVLNKQHGEYDRWIIRPDGGTELA